MNQRGTARLLRFLTCVPVLLLLLASENSRAQGMFPGKLLVRLVPGASITRVAQEYGLTVVDSVKGRNVYEVVAYNDGTGYATQCFLNSDSRVQYCECEAEIGIGRVQATPFHISFDISLDATAYINQVAYGLIHLGVSSSIITSSAVVSDAALGSITVAVLDTGVDYLHPALAGSLLPGYNAINPWFPPLDIPDGWNNAVVGHGTMIAGIISRVSPNSMVMPIRVLNSDGVGEMMNVIKGIDYAVNNGAQVISMSFETDRNSMALADALNEAHNAGIVLVASAGNDSTNAPRYPASYANVVGVASVENDDTLSAFSNFGVNATLVAPGSSIRSTYWDGSYATWNGTSFAAPFAAAEAAEILAMSPTLTPAQVVATMVNTADNIDYLNPLYANLLGAGIIDIQAALASPGP